MNLSNLRQSVTNLSLFCVWIEIYLYNKNFVIPVNPFVSGHKSSIQISDMNTQNMNRPYRKYLQRIDEMDRQLRFLYEEV